MVVGDARQRAASAEHVRALIHAFSVCADTSDHKRATQRFHQFFHPRPYSTAAKCNWTTSCSQLDHVHVSSFPRTTSRALARGFPPPP